MSGDDTHEGADPRLIERVIKQRVAERAAEWFPDLGRSRTVRLQPLSFRPRCALYAVHLGDDSKVPQILAKVRRSDPLGGSDDGRVRRPRLRTDSLTAAGLTALEYGGLQSIFATFGTSHANFGAVRPLDHLTSESAILMDYVHASTLRQLFIAESRVMPRGRLAQRRPATREAWHHAGAWLRAFH
ncbi:MAG: hypothetical protein ABJA81_02295 [Nocardioidaceae bacterium]